MKNMNIEAMNNKTWKIKIKKESKGIAKGTMKKRIERKGVVKEVNNKARKIETKKYETME